MSHALVSVVVPAWNAERWIGASIESALAQTWPSVEVIVVDDGSTDGTVDVVRRYPPARVRLVQQAHAGQSAAQNAGLAAAHGAFIQYLDADDLLSPDKVERQMRRLSDAPQCVASGEWARFVADPSEARFVPEPVWRDLEAVQWLTDAWTGGLPMMQGGLWLIPRAVADAAGPWDERLSLINDLDYFTRVLLASHGVRFVEGARLYYRSGNPESLASRRSPAAWSSALRSIEQATSALLARSSTPITRRACADLFQGLAFDAYLADARVADAAEARARQLGGSPLRMGGGWLLHALEFCFGWKRAKRIKRFGYRLGYARIARLKSRSTARAGAGA